jgi:hypothetical protein
MLTILLYDNFNDKQQTMCMKGPAEISVLQFEAQFLRDANVTESSAGFQRLWMEA